MENYDYIYFFSYQLANNFKFSTVILEKKLNLDHKVIQYCPSDFLDKFPNTSSGLYVCLKFLISLSFNFGYISIKSVRFYRWKILNYSVSIPIIAIMAKFIKNQKNEKANKSKKKIDFFFLTRLFFAISIILVFWVLIVAFGLYVGMGHNWALLDIEMWSFIVISVLLILIFIDFLFIFILARKKGEELTSFEEADSEFIHGKRVFVFTNPKNAEGGIFSKTYIILDDNSVLKLRELMTPPEELWD